MSAWYASLSGLEQFLFLTAIFSTLIFLIQFVATFFGLADEDVDSGEGEGSFSIGDVFTIRNGVSFLMGLSWGGLMAFSWGVENTFLVAFVGFFIGMTFVGINMLLLFAMAQLRHDGSIDLANALDTEATVTLQIPGERAGVGKVLVPIQGRLKEYHAVTDGASIAKNATVTVVDLSGSQLVVRT